MKTLYEKIEIRAAFTIVELLTVMSIIAILIGILVPSINTVKKHARNVEQMAQFHSIDVAIEMFSAEHEGYPPSDNTAGDYCGAMKLCEALVGQDLLGYHPESNFTIGAEDNNGDECYDLTNSNNLSEDNIRARLDLFLPLEQANAYRLSDLYDPNQENLGSFDENSFILCDVFPRAENKGGVRANRIGLPILYYRADTSKEKHDVKLPDSPDNIYSYKDNDDLVGLGIPWDSKAAPDQEHPMYSGFSGKVSYGIGRGGSGSLPAQARFYIETKNEKVGLSTGQPYRADSYLLMSAGNDGLFGTSDDIFNFGN